MIQLPPPETLTSEERYKIMRESGKRGAWYHQLSIRYCAEHGETWWFRPYTRKNEKAKLAVCIRCEPNEEKPHDEEKPRQTTCRDCGNMLCEENKSGYCRGCSGEQSLRDYRERKHNG